MAWRQYLTTAGVARFIISLATSAVVPFLVKSAVKMSDFSEKNFCCRTAVTSAVVSFLFELSDKNRVFFVFGTSAVVNFWVPLRPKTLFLSCFFALFLVHVFVFLDLFFKNPIFYCFFLHQTPSPFFYCLFCSHDSCSVSGACHFCASPSGLGVITAENGPRLQRESFCDFFLTPLAF